MGSLLGSSQGAKKMQKRESFEYDEEKERQAEELVKREHPELHYIMSSFKHLADEKEQEGPQEEEKEQPINKAIPQSVARLLQHRPSMLTQPFTDFTRERSMSTFLAQQSYLINEFGAVDNLLARDENSEILLTSRMKKLQAAKRDWQERFLVLRKTGLFYYESEANFKEGRPPRGKIFFFDLVRPNGAAADLVSAYLYGLLGKPYVFQVHTEKRTHVFSAASKEIQVEWVDKIIELYDVYLQEQEHRNGVMEKAWSLGEESSWSYFAKLVEKKKNLPEIVEQVNEKVLEDLGRQIEYLSNMKNIRKSFEAWRLYARLKRRQRRMREKQEVLESKQNGLVSITEGVGKMVKTIEKFIQHPFS